MMALWEVASRGRLGEELSGVCWLKEEAPKGGAGEKRERLFKEGVDCAFEGGGRGDSIIRSSWEL